MPRAVSIIIPQPSDQIFTDASLSGWGFRTSQGTEDRGKWHPYLIKLYINLKYLLLDPFSLFKSSSDMGLKGRGLVFGIPLEFLDADH